MYSWGADDVKTWKKPQGYSYDSAKAPYLDSLKSEADVKGPRTYLAKQGPDMKVVDPKGKELVSTSKNPCIVWVDGTNSMATWPKEIHDRIPLFYQTLASYRDDFDIALGVIGDATDPYSDKWPLQVTHFGKGVVLDDYINALYPEGGGGPGIRESYELAAYFSARHIKTPNAIKPFLMIMGDEKFYEKISYKQVGKHIGDFFQEDIDSMGVWKELTEKFDVYLLRKSYPGKDEQIEAQWAAAIGKDRIIPIYDPLRVVDVAMGIIAKSWGCKTNFDKNLAARQDTGGIASVEASIRAAPISKKSGDTAKNLAEGSA